MDFYDRYLDLREYTDSDAGATLTHVPPRNPRDGCWRLLAGSGCRLGCLGWRPSCVGHEPCGGCTPKWRSSTAAWPGSPISTTVMWTCGSWIRTLADRVATSMLAATIALARQHGTVALTTYASLTAKPLFERHGFVVTEERHFLSRDEAYESASRLVALVPMCLRPCPGYRSNVGPERDTSATCSVIPRFSGKAFPTRARSAIGRCRTSRRVPGLLHWQHRGVRHHVVVVTVADCLRDTLGRAAQRRSVRSQVRPLGTITVRSYISSVITPQPSGRLGPMRLSDGRGRSRGSSTPGHVPGIHTDAACCAGDPRNRSPGWMCQCCRDSRCDAEQSRPIDRGVRSSPRRRH